MDLRSGDEPALEGCSAITGGCAESSGTLNFKGAAQLGHFSV